ARPRRLVVPIAAALVWRDVRVPEEHLAALRPGERLAQVDLARPHRLDLGALQRQPGLHLFQDVVVVERLAIAGVGAVGALLLVRPVAHGTSVPPVAKAFGASAVTSGVS